MVHTTIMWRCIPVTFSPVIKILASVRATFTTIFINCCMAGDVPTIIGDWLLSGTLFFLFLPLPKASFILRTKVRLSQGFNKKSVASFFKALTASSTSPYAVSMTMGSAGAISRIRFSQYNPSLPLLIPAEKFISRIITSTGEVFRIDII